jgi:hypothetical protein
MNYRNEAQMYPDVVQWLRQFLPGKLPDSVIDVRDTHASPLNEYIHRHGLQNYFRGDLWQTYDIRVDIAAFIESDQTPGLVLVECKTVPVSLVHLSQLLGYCRVALPLQAYLISTRSAGDAVQALILRYDRTDILEYHWGKGEKPRQIVIAKWDARSRSIDYTSLLPPGA